MKKQLYPIALLTLLVLVLHSCVQTTYLDVRRPALIDLPADLDSVVVINKSKVAKGNGNQLINVLESVASGEPILGDKYGAKSSVQNMQRLIRESDRLDLVYEEIIEIELRDITGNTPLNGDFIDSLCKEHNADGIIALELFDSDSYDSNNSSQVRTRWRVYYPNERKIIDEFLVYSGATDYNYYSVVPPAYTSISKAGALGAQIYFDRIIPNFRKESRIYYVSGSPEMKASKKSVRQGEWEQAMYLWEIETESRVDDKVYGKAAFNLALAYEIKDDFEKALEWIDASIAAGNKRAITYKALLRLRRDEKEKIDQQLNRE